MMGAGAANTGSSLMRRGREVEEDSSLAKKEGRNAVLLTEFLAAAVTEVRHQPLMEAAIDIVRSVFAWGGFIPAYASL